VAGNPVAFAWRTTAKVEASPYGYQNDSSIKEVGLVLDSEPPPAVC
jgi:hypothetical protein